MRYFRLCVLVCCFGLSFGKSSFIRLLEKHGVVESPFYPTPYDNLLNSTWEITAEPGYRVVLYFTKFDLEDSYNDLSKCPNDRLEIFDGQGTFGNITSVRLCGKSIDNTPDSPVLFDQRFRSLNSNTLTVQFITDFSSDGDYAAPKGFRALFYQEDIDECAELEQAYKSSNDPSTVKKCDHFCNNYPGGYYCSCRDGYATLNRFFCIGKCSGNVITNSEGDIATPGYPGNYPKSTNCDWTIATQPGKVIRMTFQPTFGIEGYSRLGMCPYDYLKVIDSMKTLLLCDSNFAYNGTALTSYGNKVKLQFHSDDFIQGNGFKIHYRATAVVCPTPVVPTYGRILQTYSGGNGQLSFNSVVVFECQRGTKMVGTYKIKCLKDGSWSAQVPSCIKT